MGSFELQDTRNITAEIEERCLPKPSIPKPKIIKDECIVANKVYDSCRRQDCLTPRELGPSRAAVRCTIGEEAHQAGDVIRPPSGAASVSMDDLKITKIHVLDKKPCPFRRGFWDVDIKYTFEYKLTFLDTAGCEIGNIEAQNVFTGKTLLFGSIGGGLTIGTDLFTRGSEAITFDSAPLIWVEAKAVGLGAKLHHHHGGGHHHSREVHCTIGLFCTLKLFRIVHLNVQSTGFCIPEECTGSHDVNPCEFFTGLDFPMDLFAPPKRQEFMAGQGGNIPQILMK